MTSFNRISRICISPTEAKKKLRTFRILVEETLAMVL